ncbi:MAG: GvpL/GvpF family gas vesicle protein [Deltaproteobacteria bacterium]|nr:GvpL/GvpF family gas vesicle protein [Deltaproteobacteria bacterium]
MNESGPHIGKFVYAVVLSEGRPIPDLVGLDGGRIQAIHQRDIAAAVSDFPASEIKPLRRNLAPYYEVVRTLAEHCTTVPAVFGQIARSPNEVLRVLQVNYEEIRGDLDRLDRKVEMGVKVFWELENVFEYLVRRDARLSELRSRLLSKGSRVTRQQQIDFGALAKDLLDRAREDVWVKVTDQFEDTAVEIKLNDCTEERMAMNGLFLIRKDGKEEFFAGIERLDGLLGEEYVVKVDGPWVPFNFVERLELDL